MAKKKEAKTMKGFSVRPDGRLYHSFRYKGKVYAVYGMTLEECILKKQLKKAAVDKEEAEGARYKSGKVLTVSEYFDRWLNNKIGTVKETTLRTDRILLNRISGTKIDAAGTAFGSLKMAKVEPQNVRDLQRALSGSVKTRTVNDCCYLLKAVFKSAVIDGDLQRNPAEGLKPLKRTEEAARDTIHRALTKEETAAFLDAAERLNSWYLPLYSFLLNTGLRVGEAGALLPGDITKKSVRICRTITRTEVGGYMIGDETKTAAGKRTVPLNDAALRALEDQREVNMLLWGNKIIDMMQPVFVSPTGALIKSASVNYDINKICKAAGTVCSECGAKKPKGMTDDPWTCPKCGHKRNTGIGYFSVHAFRDTFATRCVESGMQIKPLQEIMGHTDVTMTMGLYTHAMEKAKEEQLKAVNFT